MEKEKETNKVPCLITTDKRGVFMGYVDPATATATVLEAEDIRMCVRWSNEVKGVIGLAATGPTKNCRVTKAAKKGILHGVTACLEITKEAEKNWLQDYWG
jgi:hypothetical protein